MEGVSRSVAVVIGYLMIREGLPYVSAFDRVRAKRRVASPNGRFFGQLCQLQEILGLKDPTCDFTMKKMIAFSVILKRGVITAVPVNGPTPEGEDKTVVTVDYQHLDSLMQKDGRPVKVTLKRGSDESLNEFAEKFVADVKAVVAM
jgi:hypothetical protein